jgi:hypothetical protein
MNLGPEELCWVLLDLFFPHSLAFSPFAKSEILLLVYKTGANSDTTEIARTCAGPAARLRSSTICLPSYLTTILTLLDAMWVIIGLLSEFVRLAISTSKIKS